MKAPGQSEPNICISGTRRLLLDVGETGSHSDSGRIVFDVLPLARILRGEELQSVEVTLPIPRRTEQRHLSVGGSPLRDAAGAVEAAVRAARTGC